MNKVSVGKRACVLFVFCAAAAITMLAQTTAVSPTVTFTTVHNFGGTEGQGPSGPLVQGSNGDLYGTSGGGARGACPLKVGGCGMVYKITTSGELTRLYSFCPHRGCSDGIGPDALVRATNGDFYGTTYFGGTNNDGTIFKITPDGVLTTLDSFNGTDGQQASASLVQAGDGNFYGTTTYGGANDESGTVFRITPGGTFTVIYNFCSHVVNNVCLDGGGGSSAALVLATDGNLYGTTSYGGTNNDGTVFKITTNGALTTLHSLVSQTVSSRPGWSQAPIGSSTVQRGLAGQAMARFSV